MRKPIVALAALLALAGCMTIETREAALPPGSRYVALGSSFAAGAGIGPTKPGTPERCQRTAINYATLLARRLGLTLDDQTCGGATTAHVLGPWNELPPQADAITAETRLVTVTIGGNDLRYVAGLMGSSCRAGAPVMPGPCWPTQVPTEDDYAKAEAALRKVAQVVAERAPRARLVFVQYVTLVPEQPCAAAMLVPADAAIGRVIGVRLAAITARVAQESGALVLPADELSRGHTPCSAMPWSHGMSVGYDRKEGAPWHPNAAGHAAIASALAEQLGG